MSGTFTGDKSSMYFVERNDSTSSAPRNRTPSLKVEVIISPVGNNIRSRLPRRDEMDAVFQLCRKNLWTSVLNSVRNNPGIAITSMTMQNHITTTIIHQAITSKGDTSLRARVVEEILDFTPEAASIKNGYGSLPLHVIAQRNTKMNAVTKERLIRKLVHACPAALTQQGGVGLRTPLHIIFTDYISPKLTEEMIQQGHQACFMRDKKGYLPVHVACSRHCSPEKLKMLLDINPSSLYETTKEGESLLDLATKTATKSHPNYALIGDLRRRLSLSPPGHLFAPNRVSSNDESEETNDPLNTSQETANGQAVRHLAQISSFNPRTRKRKRKITAVDDVAAMINSPQEQAHLLLQFSRQTHNDIKNFASV